MNLLPRSLACFIIMVLSTAFCGCGSSHVADTLGHGGALKLKKIARARPRTRMGSFASSTFATTFLGPENLGKHSYRYNFFERSGIMYTCDGGHIDIAHLRNAADWTAYLAAITYDRMMDNAAEFKFRLAEGTIGCVRIEYPGDWPPADESERAAVLYDMSTGLGQYFAYQASIWHEIATWFGYKGSGFISEFGSAFSWEDIFSNLLGCRIGYMALYDDEHSFNKAVTLAMNAELQKLHVQSKKTARRASDMVRGQWFSGDMPVVVMKGRNFDIGLDDGAVTPWIVRGLGECQNPRAHAYSVPDPAFLDEYGFSVKFEIEPKIWEKNKIFSIVYPDGEKKKRFEPATQLAVVMDYIMKEAARHYGAGAGVSKSK